MRGRTASWTLLAIVGCSSTAGSGPTLRAEGDETLARFAQGVAHLSIGDARVSIGLASIGRDGAMHDAHAARASGMERVELIRDDLPGVVEWWTRAPRGLEHGVTIEQRPAGDGALVLSLRVAGVAPRTISAEVIALGERARYAGLSAIDASGARLPASMRADGGAIRIEVDDSAARYPVVIDPLVYAIEAMLPQSSTVTDARVGFAVAMTPDGTRLVVGEPGTSTSTDTPGRATMWLRSGTTWTQEAVLAVPGLANGAMLGAAASITADGATAALGAPYDTGGGSGVGTVRVFTRVGTSWSLSATIAPSPGSTGGTRYGSIVAISPDGARLLLSGLGSAFSNTTHVYDSSGSAWVEENTGASFTFGYPLTSASWSGDSQRLAVGRGNAGTCGGSGGEVDVYLMPAFGFSWPAPAEFTATGCSSDRLGTGIAINGDGSWLVATAPGSGHVSFYSRVGTAWTLQSSLAVQLWNTSGSAVPPFPPVVIAGDAAVAYASSGGSFLDSFVRTGSAWSVDPTFFTVDATMLATTATGSRVAAGGFFSNGAHTSILHVSLPNGDGCDTNDDCGSGFCVDRVCCESACGGGYAATGTNCSACAARYTGLTDGRCGPLSATYAGGVTCRASNGRCDTAAMCSSTSTVCPPNPLMTGNVCRAASNVCQLPATCDGTSAACPPNAAGNAGTACRAMSGVCDVAEACDGVMPSCPADAFATSSMPCRFATDLCDRTEYCTGTSVSCPADMLRPAGTVCRPAGSDVCDVADTCTGITTSCPAVFAAAGTTCRPAVNVCDVAESCTGVTPLCPADGFMPATTVCASSSGAVCDAPDVCSGTTATCVPTYATGVVCRPAAGACDVAESCAGTAPACPPDAVLGAGVSCRASTMACDPQESCDGSSTSCPADVNSCMPDAGIARDAGSAPDAATMNDAAASRSDSGTTPAPVTGSCGCRMSSTRAPSLLALVLALLPFARRTRRRRPRSGT